MIQRLGMEGSLGRGFDSWEENERLAEGMGGGQALPGGGFLKSLGEGKIQLPIDFFAGLRHEGRDPETRQAKDVHQIMKNLVQALDLVVFLQGPGGGGIYVLVAGGDKLPDGA